MKNISHIPEHFLKRMQLFALWLINREKTHGYGLIKLLRKEGMQASPNRLYPLLNLMMKQGLISQKKEAQGKRVRKIYALTPKGKKFLSHGKTQFSGLISEFLKEMIQK